MADDLDDLSLASAADFAVKAVEEVQTASEELPSPTFVTNAVRPEVVVIEGGEVGDCVSDEAARRVGVHAEQERDEQVMSVPERFERLLTDPVVGSGVDQKHEQKHEMSSDTTSLGVVDLKRDLGSHLYSLNVEEAVCC